MEFVELCIEELQEKEQRLLLHLCVYPLPFCRDEVYQKTKDFIPDEYNLHVLFNRLEFDQYIFITKGHKLLMAVLYQVSAIGHLAAQRLQH